MGKYNYSPIIISGPSGSGKTELINYIELNNDNYIEACGITTRARRPDEKDKIVFVTLEDFKKEIENDTLIEYTIYNGNYYGMFKSELDKLVDKNLIFNVSYSSAKAIKELDSDSRMIYILPPTKEELIRRLGDRGQNRYDLGREETINYALYYEYLLISYTDEIEKVYNDFISIVEEKSESQYKKLVLAKNKDFVKNYYN